MCDLSLKDFGPVSEAEIHFSSLTVFTGENNCGKSFTTRLFEILSNPFADNMEIFASKCLEYVTENSPDLFDDFKKKVDTNQNQITYSLDKFLNLIVEGFSNVCINLIEIEMRQKWKTSLNNLNRMKKFPFKIQFNGIDFITSNGKLTSPNIGDKIISKVKSMDDISYTGVNIHIDDKVNIDVDYSQLNNFISLPLSHLIYIMVINRMLDDFRVNSYNIADNPEDYISFKRGAFYNLACQMEEEIFGSETKITDEGKMIQDVQFDLNMLTDSDLQLIRLIVYLKHCLQKGDFLILNEIENNMHPQNQVILAKYIVKAVNQGLNIILTTHSDFIIERFNNLIQLANTSKEVFDHIEYDESFILDYGGVSIYDFKKSDVKNIDVNFTGFNLNTFSDVSDQLINESDIMEDFKLN